MWLNLFISQKSRPRVTLGRVSCLVHVQIQLQLLKSLLYFSNSRPVKGLKHVMWFSRSSAQLLVGDLFIFCLHLHQDVTMWSSPISRESCSVNSSAAFLLFCMTDRIHLPPAVSPAVQGSFHAVGTGLHSSPARRRKPGAIQTNC